MMVFAHQLAPLTRATPQDALSSTPSEITPESDWDDLRQAREASRGSPYLSSKEAARYLGFNYRSLQNMRQRGGGPRFVRLGRQVRYHIRDLLSYAQNPVEPRGRS